jgi:hypothetical protein
VNNIGLSIDSFNSNWFRILQNDKESWININIDIKNKWIGLIVGLSSKYKQFSFFLYEINEENSTNLTQIYKYIENDYITLNIANNKALLIENNDNIKINIIGISNNICIILFFFFSLITYLTCK